MTKDLPVAGGTRNPVQAYPTRLLPRARGTDNSANTPHAGRALLEKGDVLIPTGKLAQKFSTFVADIIAKHQPLNLRIQNLHRTRDQPLPWLLSERVEAALRDGNESQS